MEKWQDPNTLLTLILITFGVFIFLVISLFGITYFAFKKILAGKKRENDIAIAHKNKLIQSNLETQEKERIRIASELHDGIIGKIAAIRLQVAMNSSPHVLDTQIGETIDEVRRISHDLYPPSYEVQSLHVIIDNVLVHYKGKYTLDKHNNVDKDVLLPLRPKIQILRIVQELLHNIEKHAGATHLFFYLKITKNHVCFMLSDNGHGFDVAKNSAGQGLQNVELRCMSIGAHYKYKSKTNNGTKFIFYLSIYGK